MRWLEVTLRNEARGKTYVRKPLLHIVKNLLSNLQSSTDSVEAAKATRGKVSQTNGRRFHDSANNSLIMHECCSWVEMLIFPIGRETLGSQFE